MAVGIVVPYTFATQNGPLPLANLDSDILTPYQALSAFATYGNYLVDSSGAANTITVTTPTNTTFSYTAGVPIQVKLANTNTAAAVSINVNGLGSVSVLNADGTNPAIGQLVAAQILPMIYNGAAFVLSGPQSKPSSIAPFTANAAGNVTLPAPSSGTSLTINGVAGSNALLVVASSTTGQSNGLGVSAGTNQSDTSFQVNNQSNSTAYFKIYGDGSIVTNGRTPQGAASLNVGSLYVTEGPVYAGIPQNNQPNNYTLVLSDANKHIYHSSTTAHTYTIPANSSVAFPVGSAVTFVNPGTGGALTIGITTDSMFLAGATNTTGSRTLTAVGVATALKVAATVWIISGTGLT